MSKVGVNARQYEDVEEKALWSRHSIVKRNKLEHMKIQLECEAGVACARGGCVHV